jgi:hypothetical protein
MNAHTTAPHKVSLTRQIVEYAYSDVFVFGDSLKVLEHTKKLKQEVNRLKCMMGARRLKSSIATFSSATAGRFASYVRSKKSGDSKRITMMLFLTVPEIGEVAQRFFENAKPAYTSKDIADVLNIQVNDVSGKIDDFFKKKDSKEFIRFGTQAAHLRHRRNSSNRHEWYVSIDDDVQYAQEKVEYIIVHIPFSISNIKELLNDAAMREWKDLSQAWNTQFLWVESKAEHVVDVITARKSGLLHSRYFVNGRNGNELVRIFGDRKVASAPL